MRNSEQQFNINNLKGMAQFVLFATSYIPLFILIACKQISENFEFLSWGGCSFNATWLCFQKFGLSILVIGFSIFGYWGYKQTFKNLGKVATNGDNVTITNVDNKNSESIGYIATYIVPFLFQSFDGWYENFAFIFLMVIIYRIYINSNLILINPVLSFEYSIFQIEYKQQDGKINNGLAISNNKYLLEGSIIKIYQIGFKLYYIKNNKNLKYDD
jgi:hypothetical protein